MSYKIDLHTHSIGSPDGGLQLKDYLFALRNNILDYIAITDHDSIDMALEIRDALAKYGDRIIIGEEITTRSGEIIGLYLKSRVSPGLPLADTVDQIKKQGGLVYVPHPFETVRSGLKVYDLENIASDVDIVEACNGRAVFQNRGTLAQQWADAHTKPVVASSDAHGRIGWGRTFTSIDQPPTRQNIAELLTEATQSTQKVGAGVLYPRLNRLRRKASDGIN